MNEGVAEASTDACSPGRCDGIPWRSGGLLLGLTFHEAAEFAQFLRQDPPRPASRQLAELDGADGQAPQKQHLVALAGQHAADLAVLALRQDDLQPSAVTVPLQP